MSDLSFNKPYVRDFVELRNELIVDDWLTPDTYDNNLFESLDDFPAVYLFFMHDIEFKEAMVGYVGMSKKLRSRITRHNILPQLRKTDFFVSTWFQRHNEEHVREIEAEYITKYQPPWNIVGKARGVAL